MILTTPQLIITIAIMALMTFLTRVVPFILFPGHKSTPKYISYLGEVLPFAIIGMLIIYCLKEVHIFASPHGIPELVAIIFVTLLHIWKKNTLLSISGGTLLYMFLVQVVFV